MSGPELEATVLSDDQRATLGQLATEGKALEGVVRAFAIRAFDALQPFIDVRGLNVSDEDAFYEWSGAVPLLDALERISDHARAAALLGTPDHLGRLGDRATSQVGLPVTK